jgi:hypothetical protein
MLNPLMPNRYWAIGMLLVRSTISEMDVPNREAYAMAGSDRTSDRPLRGSRSRSLIRRFNPPDDGDDTYRQCRMDERTILPRWGTEDCIWLAVVQGIFQPSC